MNKLFDKNGSTTAKYIGVIDETICGRNIHWVGVIKLGDQMYVPQGSGVYYDYHPYDPITGICDWVTTYKLKPNEHKELTKQYEAIP